VARRIGAQRRHYITLVIGGRDMEAGAVSVRLHHGGPQGAKAKAEVIADILAGIKERRADGTLPIASRRYGVYRPTANSRR